MQSSRSTPDNLAITNTYLFIGESDIDGISAAPMDQNAEEQEFTLSARSDKKVTGAPSCLPMEPLCVQGENDGPLQSYIP